MKSYILITALLFLFSISTKSRSTPFASNNDDNPTEIYFYKDSLKIQSWFYKSAKNEFSQIVFLLHGYPDQDKDVLGLGKFLSNEGFNVLCLNYIGTYKSEGLWDPISSIQSVEAAIDFINSEDFKRKYSINSVEKTIIGHSFGGGMAVLGSLYDSSITKVISIAGGDLGVLGNQILEDPDFAKEHQQFLDWAISDSTVSRGLGGKKTHEIYGKTLIEDFYLKDYCEQLSKKDILLIGGWNDNAIKVEDHILPLYRCLQQFNPERLNIKAFETDHSFKNVNMELKQKVLEWIKKE